MFCHKCGSNAIEGSAFCQKCGAKLMADEAAAQTTVEPIKVSAPVATENTTTPPEPMQQTHATPVPEIQEAYDRLQASTERCSKIKKIAVSKGANGTSGSSLIIHGFFHKYTYTPNANSEKTSISWSLRWMLYFVYVPILLCDALFIQFFFQQEYYLVLTICCLIGCVIWFPFLFFSHKEKSEITQHINETLDCQIKLPSKVTLIVSYVLNLIVTGLCVAAFIFGFSGNANALAADFDKSASGITENISLSQTYTDENEGFSFMYPADWIVENVEEVDPSAFVCVASTGMLGVYSRISVSKDEIDETIFSATKSDFEVLYSHTDGLSDVEVMELTDVKLSGHPARKVTIACTNDDGVPCVLTQYFYNLNSNMYAVSCMAIKESFDRYEPILDTIMESYTITTANTSDGNKTSPNLISYKGISIGYLLESTDDVISLLGDSPLNDELKLRYDDMEFYHDNGVITSLVSFDPSLFEADGITLNKNRDGLIKIFGEPSEEGDGGGGYFMSYNLSDCSMYFELGEPASEAWRVSISPSATTDSASSEMLSNGEPIRARDFVGTYSYDASFETPAGQYTNFYYLLEIGEDGKNLVVTETWRGNDILDHVRVSPENLTGNTLVVKTNIEVYDKESYSLTYIPAKDSPSGKDTIYIDGDDTMPFVRE